MSAYCGLRRCRLDLIGQQYGRWTILAHAPRKGAKRFLFLCRCACGTERVCQGSALRNGSSQSCGCLQRELTSRRFTTHGHTARGNSSREYQAWADARSRCTNPRNECFHLYGGRSITMCAAWLASFVQFLADMGPCPPGFFLDRINPNGNYEPGNCRWIDRYTSAVNTRNPVQMVTLADGTILSARQYALSQHVSSRSNHSSPASLSTAAARRGSCACSGKASMHAVSNRFS